VVNPITGEGFDAPTPAVAYADAPPLEVETKHLVALADRLRDERIAAIMAPDIPYTDPVGPAEERMFRLRKAAWLDRAALQGLIGHVRPDTEYEAVRAASELVTYDREHRTWAGPIGPDNQEWSTSHRPYVRQEYALWTTPSD
jgi:hypothetical protein